MSKNSSVEKKQVICGEWFNETCLTFRHTSYAFWTVINIYLMLLVNGLFVHLKNARYWSLQGSSSNPPFIYANIYNTNKSCYDICEYYMKIKSLFTYHRFLLLKIYWYFVHNSTYDYSFIALITFEKSNHKRKSSLSISNDWKNQINHESSFQIRFFFPIQILWINSIYTQHHQTTTNWI